LAKFDTNLIILITGMAKQVTVLKYPCTAPPFFRVSRDYTFSFTQRPNYIATQKKMTACLSSN